MRITLFGIRWIRWHLIDVHDAACSANYTFGKFVIGEPNTVTMENRMFFFDLVSLLRAHHKYSRISSRVIERMISKAELLSKFWKCNWNRDLRVKTKKTRSS